MILRKRVLGLLAGACILLGVGGAYAATQTVTATIKFFSDITFVTVASPNFGYVKAGVAATCVLSTAGVMGGCVSEGGTRAAGSYTIKGSTTGLINISATGYSANGGKSTPSLATCTYNGTPIAGADCTGTGLVPPTAAGLPLLVGLSVTTLATTTDSEIDSPIFNLNVVYQ